MRTKIRSFVNFYHKSRKEHKVSNQALLPLYYNFVKVDKKNKVFGLILFYHKVTKAHKVNYIVTHVYFCYFVVHNKLPPQKVQLEL